MPPLLLTRHPLKSGTVEPSKLVSQRANSSQRSAMHTAAGVFSWAGEIVTPLPLPLLHHLLLLRQPAMTHKEGREALPPSILILMQ